MPVDGTQVSAAVAVFAMVMTFFTNWRGQTKREGRNDEKLINHENRLKAHGLEIDGVKERLSYHGERIASLESYRDEHE